MPFNSPFPDLDIPKTDILSYLFPKDKPISDAPIWIDSKNTEEMISAIDLLQWVRRLGVGLDRLGIKEGERISQRHC